MNSSDFKRFNEEHKISHKEEMKYLKENDPIMYSELTSDPTGPGELPTFGGCFFIILVALVVIISLYLIGNLL